MLYTGTEINIELKMLSHTKINTASKNRANPKHKICKQNNAVGVCDQNRKYGYIMRNAAFFSHFCSVKKCGGLVNIPV